MLEKGNFYKNDKFPMNKYRCIKIDNSLVTMWVHIITPEGVYIPLQQNNGTIKMCKDISTEYTQDIKYSGQYTPIIDTAEIRKLTIIYNRQHNISHPMFPSIKIDKLTDDFFFKVMEEIDKDFSIKNLPVPGRELKAVFAITKKLGIDNLNILGNSTEPAISNFYTTNNLSNHIVSWYKKRYGGKLNLNCNIGCMILNIKNVPFKVNFPLLFGKMTIIWDDPQKEFPAMAVNSSNGYIFNLPNHIKDITLDLSMHLSADEKKGFVNLYGTTFQAVYKYKELHLPYFKEALADLQSSVDTFFSSSQQYGQSKWESLQFTEKLLKGILEYKNISFNRIHDLRKLATQIVTALSIRINMDDIDKINCRAEVRYNGDSVSKKDALDAHLSSLSVLRSVINQI